MLDLNRSVSPKEALVPGLITAVAAVLRSVRIGFVATLGATVLGTMLAFPLARYRFRGRSAANVLVFLPMAMPEVVLGSSLLTLYVAAGVPLGFWTVSWTTPSTPW